MPSPAHLPMSLGSVGGGPVFSTAKFEDASTVACGSSYSASIRNCVVPKSVSIAGTRSCVVPQAVSIAGSTQPPFVCCIWLSQDSNEVVRLNDNSY